MSCAVHPRCFRQEDGVGRVRCITQHSAPVDLNAVGLDLVHACKPWLPVCMSQSKPCCPVKKCPRWVNDLKPPYSMLCLSFAASATCCGQFLSKPNLLCGSGNARRNPAAWLISGTPTVPGNIGFRIFPFRTAHCRHFPLLHPPVAGTPPVHKRGKACIAARVM